MPKPPRFRISNALKGFKLLDHEIAFKQAEEARQKVLAADLEQEPVLADALKKNSVTQEQFAEIHSGLQYLRDRYEDLGNSLSRYVPYYKKNKNKISGEELANIMRRHRERSYFRKDAKTGLPNYDQDLAYRSKKFNFEYSYTMMSPSEYIYKATNILNEKFKTNRSTKDIIAERAGEVPRIRSQLIRNGNFYLPYLDTTKNSIGQEGLTRAIAAMDLGLKEIPVLEVFTPIKE